MTTPAQLRQQARDLRSAARVMETKAGVLPDSVKDVLTHYPHSREGVWYGTAATDFYDGLDEASTDLDNLATDLRGYASDCRVRATRLDEEASELAAELARQAEED